MEKLVPNRAISPGEILREELKERKIKQRRFAYMIDMRPHDFNEIIKGKRRMDDCIAQKIDALLGPHIGEFLLRFQKGYEEDRKEIAKRRK